MPCSSTYMPCVFVVTTATMRAMVNPITTLSDEQLPHPHPSAQSHISARLVNMAQACCCGLVRRKAASDQQCPGAVVPVKTYRIKGSAGSRKPGRDAHGHMICRVRGVETKTKQGWSWAILSFKIGLTWLCSVVSTSGPRLHIIVLELTVIRSPSRTTNVKVSSPSLHARPLRWTLHSRGVGCQVAPQHQNQASLLRPCNLNY